MYIVDKKQYLEKRTNNMDALKMIGQMINEYRASLTTIEQMEALQELLRHQADSTDEALEAMEIAAEEAREEAEAKAKEEAEANDPEAKEIKEALNDFEKYTLRYSYRTPTMIALIYGDRRRPNKWEIDTESRGYLLAPDRLTTKHLGSLKEAMAIAEERVGKGDPQNVEPGTGSAGWIYQWSNDRD